MRMDFDEEWGVILRGITKLKKIIEESPENKEGFSTDEYILLYTAVYQICTQTISHDNSQKLYDKYKETFEEYNHSTVLPSIREKHGEVLLRELVSRWENNKLMISWMSSFFQYLGRFFIPLNSLPCLKKVGISCFRNQVYKEVKVEVQAAIIALSEKLSDQEKAGEQVERALLEIIQNIIVEIDKNGSGRLRDLELE